MLILGNADAGVADRNQQTDPVRTLLCNFGGKLDLPGIRKLRGIAGQVGHYLFESMRVTLDKRREIVGNPAKHLDGFIGDSQPDEIGNAVYCQFRIKLYLFKIQVTGFDLGKIQDIVDQGEEGLAALLDGLAIISLFVVQARVGEHVGEADDPVHGGADLMAHGGKEDAFELVGLFGHAPRLFKFLVLQLDILGVLFNGFQGRFGFILGLGQLEGEFFFTFEGADHGSAHIIGFLLGPSIFSDISNFDDNPALCTIDTRIEAELQDGIAPWFNKVFVLFGFADSG